MSKVCVEEGETSVRVVATKPHLVSLGGGRLSTAITIHPLERGKTVLGSGRNADIQVSGQGVEDVHCSIENDGGVLTLISHWGVTTVDGDQVTKPRRLTQGSILGLGKTTFFRFNHPDQARMIKKSLPDVKSTVLTFYQGLDGHTPYHHLESRSRDALNELSQFLIKGYSPENGENNEVGSPKKSLPSPSYNRDPSQFSSQKPPIKNSPQQQYPLHNDKGKNDKLDNQLALEEILNMCTEYDRQMQHERSSKPVQNRIMTNGSLPREKRSPQSSPLSSSLFGNSESPDHVKDKEKKLHTYENVSFTSGSPRPRIKTFLNKENQIKENGAENRIPLVLDLKQVNGPLPSRENNNASPIYNNVSPSSETSSIGDSKTDENTERRTEMLKAMKYNFLGYSPVNSSAYKTCDQNDSTCAPQSPSWTNPKLDMNSFPDYEILTGPEENVKFQPEDDIPPDKLHKLLVEKDCIQQRLISLKNLIKELERQEQEMIQETAFEEALVSGELNAQDEKLAQDEKRIAVLKERISECDIAMEKCLAQQGESQEHFNIVKAKHMSIIETLEHKIRNCSDETLKYELNMSLKEQMDLLDVERKSHELLEFQLLEEEAGWLSKREDLQKELNDAIERHKLRKAKVEELKKAKPTISNNLELERIVHLKEIEEGRNRLNEINEKIDAISVKQTVKGLTDGVVRRRVTSQDDLDRISRVTSGAPIDMGDCNSLGRRTIASLQEIERNRQIHLANQGSLVIQEERQRVEELKKRVQDEVKAQWQLNRNSNCQSFTSMSDSSLEPTRDSGVSSEEAEKGLQPVDEVHNKPSPVEVSVTPESRPLSDASGYSDDQQNVKLRSKSSMNLQRPLTRYLPIRSDTLDLKRHIESAGHQVDLCPHLTIDSTSCRGYLNKMSTKFNSRWNKRWFVFDRVNRTFSYYSDKSEKKVRGGAYFQAIEEVYVDHLNTFKSPNSKVTFVVKSSNRLYNLEAPSPEAMRIWVDVIFTGAEGYQHNYI
ncbi:uncharacterized protein LOC106666797 isoform X2 [Cimex lectularius]|uniref:PH domain-containing protein n=1 Tax=Cimex lectularius TaxID=79782 RepID=A0A8I6SUZ9_CIMLE|nr:uncharacterized protein LOC106666797 isoform X2 [Cimex lectularius]